MTNDGSILQLLWLEAVLLCHILFYEDLNYCGTRLGLATLAVWH